MSSKKSESISTIDLLGDSTREQVWSQGMESFHRELLRSQEQSPEVCLGTLREFGRETRQRSPLSFAREDIRRTRRDSAPSSTPDVDKDSQEQWSYQYQVALERCGVVFSPNEHDFANEELDSSSRPSDASDISESDDELHSVMTEYVGAVAPPSKRQCRTDVRVMPTVDRGSWENSLEGEILSSDSMRYSPLECHEQSLSDTLGSQGTVSLHEGSVGS